MAIAPAAPQSMDPTAPSTDPSMRQDEGQESFTVCISAQADGTFQVYAKDSDDGASYDQGTAPAGQGGDSGRQTAANVDEALALAKQLLEQEAGEDAQEPAEGTDPQAVWNQLAKKTDAKRGMQ